MARIVRQDRLFSPRVRARWRLFATIWRQLWSAPLEHLSVLFAFAAIAFVGAAILSDGAVDVWLRSPKPNVQIVSSHFAECRGPARITCVVDGDTLWIDGSKIRIADIDTPEVSSPSCAHELALGQRATRRLAELLNAGPFEVTEIDRKTDVYGRDLRIISRNGLSLGAALVREGLAREWDGSRHSWCV